jgi:hypothetical protein
VQPGGLERRGKLVVGGIMVLILGFTLIALQTQFDQGDNRRAVELLMSKPPGDRWSVAEELNARAGAEHPTCTPSILSSFAGTMEVTCAAGPPPPYVFEVDLVRKSVRPGNEQATALMRSVAARNATEQSDAAIPDAG